MKSINNIEIDNEKKYVLKTFQNVRFVVQLSMGLFNIRPWIKHLILLVMEWHTKRYHLISSL